MDFWDDLSRTSSQERSESSEKLKFLRDFKSGTHSKTKYVYKKNSSFYQQLLDLHLISPDDFPRGDVLFLPESCVVELEDGVLGQDLSSFFFLSFL